MPVCSWQGAVATSERSQVKQGVLMGAPLGLSLARRRQLGLRAGMPGWSRPSSVSECCSGCCWSAHWCAAAACALCSCWSGRGAST
eukprot:894982-Alexandrium_andersonii.AAC.1